MREHQPAFAFLDIEMPVMNGLEAAREIARAAHVVFVTAYDRYAVEAFERGAVDYVLKPAAAERLARHRAPPQGRASARPRPRSTRSSTSSRGASRPAPSGCSGCRPSLGTTLKLINVDDVLYFQSDTKYTRVVTREGEALVKKTLRELAAELDPRHFWQVHRGTIVNIRAIASVTTDDPAGARSRCKDRAEKLEVSRTFAHLFKSS